MLLRLFSSKQPVIIFLILFVACLFWTMSILTIPNALPGWANCPMPLSHILVPLQINHPVGATLVGLFLVSIVAILLLRHNNRYILTQERTYLPALFYILLTASFPHQLTFHPAIIATAFLLIAYEQIIDTYQIETLTYNSFDAAFLISLASLFYLPSILFMIFLWSTLSTFRSYKWREWFYTLIGLAVPYFLYICYFYLCGIPFTEFGQNILNAIKYTGQQILISTFQLIFFILSGLIIIIASQFMIRSYQSKKIKARKILQQYFLWFLISLCIFFYNRNATEVIFMAAVPVSFLYAQFFISPKQVRIKEALFIIWITSLVLVQFSK